MPRITRVYTRTGDDGTTMLGDGQRRPKDDLRVEAYGTVDELSSQIGVARALGVAGELEARLAEIQNQLFHLGAQLCVPSTERPGPRVEARHVDALEALMDRLSEDLPPLENFVLPGGHPAAAQLHVARTVARRAERLVVGLAREEVLAAEPVRYLNRLSDALFVMARWQNRSTGLEDTLWDSRA